MLRLENAGRAIEVGSRCDSAMFDRVGRDGLMEGKKVQWVIWNLSIYLIRCSPENLHFSGQVEVLTAGKMGGSRMEHDGATDADDSKMLIHPFICLDASM